jgi:hypothetical protein
MHKKIKQSIVAAGEDVKPIVLPSSQTIAKPNVIGSLLKVHLSDFFKKEDLIDFVELVDNHKEDFKSFCNQVRQAGVEDELDSNIHLLGKQIDFLISRGYLSNCL